MTRKDYIAIARALNVLYNIDLDGITAVPSSGYQRWAACSAGNLIANELEADNPRFDREHFLAVVRGEKDLNSRPARKS
jgi:hypothetical protein